LGQSQVSQLLHSIHNTATIDGFTHDFYRYPGRFSPLFARSVIQAFTDPGDIVLDPFMGGGTSIVEAMALGRRAIGIDINELSVFVTRVKTTPLSRDEQDQVQAWLERQSESTILRQGTTSLSISVPDSLTNLGDRTTWRIQKVIASLLDSVNLSSQNQNDLARCIILRTAQWALDCRAAIPSVAVFRQRLAMYGKRMLEGLRDYSNRIQSVDHYYGFYPPFRTLLYHGSASGIPKEPALVKYSPKLIVTSPPYPGVHMLYHRWQIQGRRESSAPYWITNTNDTQGASYYTFCDRKQINLQGYYQKLFECFSSVRYICDRDTLVVQLVSFSDPEWQLPKYLSVLEEVGFRERKLLGTAGPEKARIWRNVPNRRWYAAQRPLTPSSKELVLFHSIRN